MAQLIVLNGPPGIGKSTLARRFVDEHPMTLCLEQDVVRGLLGGWLAARESESGLLARKLCIAMARTHLGDAHDVIVPQFVANPGYLDQLAGVALDAGAGYRELVLLDDLDAAERRFHARLHDPRWSRHQAVAARFVADAGGYARQYDRLVSALEGRKVVEIRTDEADLDGTYKALLAVLDSP